MIEEQKQLGILFHAIKDCYGYDLNTFSEKYSRRRIREFAFENGKCHIAELVPDLLLNADFFYLFLNFMTINYTEFYREPLALEYFRLQILPKLKTYPHINIWHAGCSTGEEPYSIAIILEEEGLLERSTIYATDISQEVLSKAKKGKYTLEHIEAGETSYKDSGGKRKLQDYFTCQNNQYHLSSNIKDSVTFAHHNVISDASFGEMNIVFFRNVSIYFKDQFQDAAITNITASLKKAGYLILGKGETLKLHSASHHFNKLSHKGIYQKM